MVSIGSKLGSAPWVLACVLTLYANGCAKSENPPDNGQTHWLQSCDDDDDCGDLSCECGVCTIPCTNDDTCTAISGITCRSASMLASGECAGEPEAPLLCLTEALASNDSGTPEPQTNPDPLHITCDAIAAEELSTDIELIGSTFNRNLASLTVSDTAVAWKGASGLHYRVGDGPLEMTAAVLGVPVLDGNELFFVQGGDLSMLSLDTGEQVAIGPDPTDTGRAVTPSDDGVYWVTLDPEGIRGQIWRSDREPGGSTEQIGAFEGEIDLTLAVLGDSVYFIRYPGQGEKVIARARRNGSANVQDLTEPIERITNVISDGTTLFATISAPDPSDDPSPGPTLVVRIEADGSVTTLFETFEIWRAQYNSMIVDDTYLYWVARSSEGASEQTLWRGRKDGQGEPQQIADRLLDGQIFIAGNSSSLYLGIYCPQAASVIRIDKPD